MLCFRFSSFVVSSFFVCVYLDSSRPRSQNYTQINYTASVFNATTGNTTLVNSTLSFSNVTDYSRFAVTKRVNLQLKFQLVNFWKLSDTRFRTISAALTGRQMAGLDPVYFSFNWTAVPAQYFAGGRMYGETGTR